MIYVNIYSYSLPYGEHSNTVFTIFLKCYCFDYSNNFWAPVLWAHSEGRRNKEATGTHKQREREREDKECYTALHSRILRCPWCHIAHSQLSFSSRVDTGRWAEGKRLWCSHHLWGLTIQLVDLFGFIPGTFCVLSRHCSTGGWWAAILQPR